jgi:hypothetical protein
LIASTKDLAMFLELGMIADGNDERSSSRASGGHIVAAVTGKRL